MIGKSTPDSGTDADVVAGPDVGADAAGDRGDPTPKPGFRERRRLDEVFGDALPTVTSDERDPDPADGAERDRWYRENRPPHHG